jgi:branched-chain amino acid transport system ATP-binding protein
LTTFIREICDEYKLGIFLIEHHMNVVMGISQRIYVLDYGETIAVGSPSEIQNNQRVIEAYLGVDESA